MNNVKNIISPKPDQNEERLENISIFDILLIFIKHLKLFILFPIVFCSITIIYVTFFADPVFVSSSKIISHSGSGGNMSRAVGIAAQFGLNFNNSNQSEPRWAYPDILKSRSLAKSVLKHKFDINQSGRKQSLLEILNYEETLQNTKFIESKAAERLLEMISVSENIETSVITLNVGAYDPFLAAQINEKFIEELDMFQKKYIKSKTSDAKKFIKERIKDTEKELISAEENLKIFKDRNRRIQNSPALQLEQQRLDREVTVLIGVFTTLKQQLETTKIEEVKESDFVVVLDPPEVPLQRSKPRKVLSVVLAGFFGIGLALCNALLINLINNSDKNDKAKLKTAKNMLKNYFALKKKKY